MTDYKTHPQTCRHHFSHAAAICPSANRRGVKAWQESQRYQKDPRRGQGAPNLFCIGRSAFTPTATFHIGHAVTRYSRTSSSKPRRCPVSMRLTCQVGIAGLPIRTELGGKTARQGHRSGQIPRTVPRIPAQKCRWNARSSISFAWACWATGNILPDHGFQSRSRHHARPRPHPRQRLSVSGFQAGCIWVRWIVVRRWLKLKSSTKTRIHRPIDVACSGGRPSCAGDRFLASPRRRNRLMP